MLNLLKLCLLWYIHVLTPLVSKPNLAKYRSSQNGPMVAKFKKTVSFVDLMIAGKHSRQINIVGEW